MRCSRPAGQLPSLSEAKGKNLYYYAVGNELNLDKFNMFVDFMYSQEGIDRNGTITGIVGQCRRTQCFQRRLLVGSDQAQLPFPPQVECFRERHVRNGLRHQSSRRH